RRPVPERIDGTDGRRGAHAVYARSRRQVTFGGAVGNTKRGQVHFSTNCELHYVPFFLLPASNNRSSSRRKVCSDGSDPCLRFRRRYVVRFRVGEAFYWPTSEFVSQLCTAAMRRRGVADSQRRGCTQWGLVRRV